MKAPALALETIEVEVCFYDAAEKAKLLAYPTAAVMQALVVKPLKIPKAEFLTYYLFHRIKLGTEGYRDYQTIGKKIHVALAHLDECVDFTTHSICAHAPNAKQLVEVSEHVGEAIGLSVISRIHGLTEADWAPIPEQKGRTAKPSFDFQIASDGTQFVQVETKGSSVVDNRVLSGAVKAQKKRIDDKKAKLVALALKGEDPNPAGIRYGTIAVVDGRKNGNARCLLTDPPADQVDEDPAVFRLLTRLRRLRDWISFLSPRSPFAAALATRVAGLEAMKNPFELDGVPLSSGISKPFDIEPYSMLNSRHSTFMSSKSRVTDGPAGGVVIQLSDSELFFIGIKEELLVMAATQGSKEIIRYKSGVDTIKKTVECTFSAGRYRRLELPASIEESATESGGYVRFPLKGNLNYSPEGLVFGILPLPEE